MHCMPTSKLLIVVIDCFFAYKAGLIITQWKIILLRSCPLNCYKLERMPLFTSQLIRIKQLVFVVFDLKGFPISDLLLWPSTRRFCANKPEITVIKSIIPWLHLLIAHGALVILTIKDHIIDPISLTDYNCLFIRYAILILTLSLNTQSSCIYDSPFGCFWVPWPHDRPPFICYIDTFIEIATMTPEFKN